MFIANHSVEHPPIAQHPSSFSVNIFQHFFFDSKFKNWNILKILKNLENKNDLSIGK